MATDEDLDETRARVERRAQELQRLYVDMQDLVREQMEKQRAMDKAELKEVNVKLSEMQSLQLSLLRAEETLYDKLRFKTESQRIDYDAIRREIGRALDRLRGADAATRDAGGAE